MKKALKMFGLIAFIAIFGFLTVSCDDGTDGTGGGTGGNGNGDDGNGGNSGQAFLGDELKIVDQQVYTISETETGYSYNEYTGSKSLNSSDNYGGTGAITNGKFSFTIGTPDSSYLVTFSINDYFNNCFDGSYDNLTISNPQVKCVIFSSFDFSDNGLSRKNDSWNISGNSESGTYGRVMYIYVNSDVTISGKGKIITDQDQHEDSVVYETLTTQNFNITLKAGWNVIRNSNNFNQTHNGSQSTYTSTESISLGDSSSYKWILEQWY